MTDARIDKVELTPLNLTMRQPFVTALGEKKVSRNLLVTVRLSNGMSGVGEASASLAWPVDTPVAMSRAIRKMEQHLVGSKISSYRRLITQTWESARVHPTAASALECAILDAFTRSRRIPLWQWLGARRRWVTTSFTLSAWPPDRAAQIAQTMFRRGFRQLKVKATGFDVDEDMRRIIAIHKAVPQAALLIDANQGFQPLAAIRFCRALRRNQLPVRLMEQPVPKENWEGLHQVEREGKIPVAADESARTVRDARRLIQTKRVAVINVKLAKCGLLGALEIIRLARAGGVRLMIGCMAESATGLSSSVHLACGSGAFEFVDLDSHLLARSPDSKPGFLTRGARLNVYPKRPGCGAQIPP